MAKKCWPRDAVILVCAGPDDARTGRMESVHPGRCRDCGGAIVYDGWSMRRASHPHFTRGRPVEFLCLSCYATYDTRTITYLEDHRRRTGQGPIEQEIHG